MKYLKELEYFKAPSIQNLEDGGGASPWTTLRGRAVDIKGASTWPKSPQTTTSHWLAGVSPQDLLPSCLYSKATWTGDLTMNEAFDKWEVKQTVVHLHRGIWLSNEREGMVGTRSNLCDSAENYAECEKATPQRFILHDSVYITFSKRQNYGHKEETG